MIRAARRMAAILDADVVDDSGVTGKHEGSWAARLAQHRVERLEPAVAHHGGRLVELADDGARAEFPSAAQALGAAIEFQQAVADANRGQPADSAVVFRLGLRLGDAGEGVARRPEQRTSEQARRGGIVVSAPLRDAVAGRVRASFAELGSAGLGTVERPIHAYEVGWDPADWPAGSAAAARTIAPPDEGKGRSRWAGAIVGSVLLAIVVYLAPAPRPPPAPAGLGVPATGGLERLQLEQRAAAAFAHWLQAQSSAARDEADDEPANPENAPPADAYDGLYSGTVTTRADSHVVTFKVKVTNGIGTGTQSRLDCGTAPVSLRIAASGIVSGMALVFSSTCLKTELAIGGRAVAGTLRLRLGSQFLELSSAD